MYASYTASVVLNKFIYLGGVLLLLFCIANLLKSL